MPVDDPETQAALAVLAEDAGTWDTELSITPYPGADPQHTRGTAVNRLVGGRWLVTDQQTESGFEGHGVYGWDPALGAYVSAWVDAMGGGIARGTGAWDPDTSTMAYDLETTYGGQQVRYREVTERHDDGTRTYRNIVTMPDGSEHTAILATFSPRSG